MENKRVQPLVSIDGVSIDTVETFKQAKHGVERDGDGIPMHACGTHSHRECPCFTCVKRMCAACFATMM